MKNFLTSDQVIEYRKLHRKEKNKRSADRIKIILALNSGYTYEEVAVLFLLDDETIRRHEKAFIEGGLKNLLKIEYKGSDAFLPPVEETKLKSHLQENIYLSTKEVARYIYNSFGIKYSTSGCRDLLKRLGFTYKKPHCVPGKRNIEKQKDFIDFYNALKKNKEEDDRIYFIDAVHPTHNTKPAYGWILKGEKKEIKTNTGRQRININGALCLEKKEVIIDEAPTINAQSTMSLLSKILLKNKNSKRIYVIADNAKYYRCKLMQEWLEKNPKIQLIYLPTYSPNLNIIERLWKYFHKKTTYNKYYEKFGSFRNAILMFFNTIKFKWDELDTLLTENFQIMGIK